MAYASAVNGEDREGPADVSDEELGALRTKIDELDTQLVSLLNERAKVVVEIGRVKRGASFFAASRVIPGTSTISTTFSKYPEL